VGEVPRAEGAAEGAGRHHDRGRRQAPPTLKGPGHDVRRLHPPPGEEDGGALQPPAHDPPHAAAAPEAGLLKRAQGDPTRGEEEREGERPRGPEDGEHRRDRGPEEDGLPEEADRGASRGRDELGVQGREKLRRDLAQEGSHRRALEDGVEAGRDPLLLLVADALHVDGDVPQAQEGGPLHEPDGLEPVGRQGDAPLLQEPPTDGDAVRAALHVEAGPADERVDHREDPRRAEREHPDGDPDEGLGRRVQRRGRLGHPAHPLGDPLGGRLHDLPEHVGDGPEQEPEALAQGAQQEEPARREGPVSGDRARGPLHGAAVVQRASGGLRLGGGSKGRDEALGLGLGDGAQVHLRARGRALDLHLHHPQEAMEHPGADVDGLHPLSGEEHLATEQEPAGDPQLVALEPIARPPPTPDAEDASHHEEDGDQGGEERGRLGLSARPQEAQDEQPDEVPHPGQGGVHRGQRVHASQVRRRHGPSAPARRCGPAAPRPLRRRGRGWSSCWRRWRRRPR